MKCSIQLRFASLYRTFHLSLHENICTIALITIHYLYNNAPEPFIICIITHLNSQPLLFFLASMKSHNPTGTSSNFTSSMHPLKFLLVISIGSCWMKQTRVLFSDLTLCKADKNSIQSQRYKEKQLQKYQTSTLLRKQFPYNINFIIVYISFKCLTNNFLTITILTT